MQKWRSKTLWLAIVAQILSILLLTKTITVADSEVVNAISGSICQVLVLLGIFNNPDKGERNV
jgi:uncharacterized membrane protein